MIELKEKRIIEVLFNSIKKTTVLEDDVVDRLVEHIIQDLDNIEEL